MKLEEYASVKKIISSGKVLEKLDLSGWIVLKNLLKKGDEIIIQPNSLFDIPVHATVSAISLSGMVGIILHTENVRDAYGYVWKTGFREGWFDIMFDIYKIVEKNDKL